MTNLRNIRALDLTISDRAKSLLETNFHPEVKLHVLDVTTSAELHRKLGDLDVVREVKDAIRITKRVLNADRERKRAQFRKCEDCPNAARHESPYCTPCGNARDRRQALDDDRRRLFARIDEAKDLEDVRELLRDIVGRMDL